MLMEMLTCSCKNSSSNNRNDNKNNGQGQVADTSRVEVCRVGGIGRQA